MARLWNRTDFRTTWDWDVGMSETTEGDYEIAKTDRYPGETMVQTYANAVKTVSGEFSLSSFGASPWKFVGNKIGPTLIRNIEDFIAVNLKRSQLTDDNFLISIKVAPISKTDLVLRIEIRNPNDPTVLFARVDALVSTQDNKIKPFFAAGAGGLPNNPVFVGA